MSQLRKTFCYCRKISISIISFLCPLPNIQPQKKKKMTDEKYSPLVTLMMKQQQPDNALMKTPDNTLPRKTIVVNCEVYHLYSLQKMIVLNNTNKLYPLTLVTRLGHTDYSKST